MTRRAWGWVLGGAVLVGMLHVYPDLRFWREIGSTHERILLWGATDETLYLSRISRAAREGWPRGNTMIYEHRDDPWIYGPAGEILLGRLAAWLRLSAGEMDVLSTFLLPMGLVLIAQQIVYAFTRSPAFSLLGAMTMTLGQYLLAKHSPLLSGQLADAATVLPLYLTRPISPQFYYLPFLLALWSMGRLVLTAAGWGWVVLAGLSLGISFYTNLFFWSFLAGGLGILAVMAWLQRRPDVAKRLLLAGLMGWLAAIPYGYNMWRTLHHPNYSDAIARLGIWKTHQLLLPLWHVAAAGIFMIGLWQHRRERWYQFITVFLLIGFVCLNQQIVTGRTFTPFHWETQTNKLVLELALIVLCWAVVGRSQTRWARLLRGTIPGLGIVLLLAHGMLVQRQYYQANRLHFASLQPLNRPLQWLRHHTTVNDVVLVNPLHFEWADYVTTISGNYTYISEPCFHASFLSRQEIEDRYFAALWFFRVTPVEAEAFIRWYHGAHFLGLAALPWYVPTPPEALARYMDSLTLRYRQWQKRSAGYALPTYKLDYVLLTRQEASCVTLEPGITRTQVYDDGTFVIWRVANMLSRQVMGGL